MITYVVVGICLSACFALFGYLIHFATKQGELEEELEDKEIEVEVQNQYVKIASRPSSSATVLLRRMRGDNIDK